MPKDQGHNYKFRQKVQTHITAQILLCLFVLVAVCLLEVLCSHRVGKALLIFLAFAASVFLAIGQHVSGGV